MRPSRPAAASRGITLVEVAVVMGVVLVLLLLVAMVLPRGRETARLVGCKKNLMEIGQAVAYYDGAQGHLPTVPAIGQAGEAPLPAMLGLLGLGDFGPLNDPKRKGFGRPSEAPPEHYISAFTCPSDRSATRGRFPAPVSYRANAGADAGGVDGPFAPGKVVSLKQVEAADGQDFTAGFAERLVGSESGEPDPIRDYRLARGPVGDDGCPDDSDSAWGLDAGSSWARVGWAWSVYNHTLRPNGSPSCVARDGKTARIGASSEHEGTIHVLMLGGSVRAFSPTVDPGVWRKFGAIDDSGRLKASP